MSWAGWSDYIPASRDGREQPAKRSKYGNRKTSIDGLTFDSAREARRWQELKMLEVAGEITNLERQKKYALTVNGQQLGVYVADFVFTERGETVVEDSKGVRTPIYKWKAKHLRAEHGITIRET
jgi:hypothetical protein